MVFSRVVDDRCLTASVRDDHGVPRGRLAELPVEEQVSRLGLARIAGYEVGIPLDQRFGVGKLRKRSIGRVGGFEVAGSNAKQTSAQRRLRIAPCTNLAGKRGNFSSGLHKPRVVVALEGFTIGVAQQAGAICDFGGDFRLRPHGLEVRDLGEPLPERGLVGRVGQAEKIRSAVVETVGPRARGPVDAVPVTRGVDGVHGGDRAASCAVESMGSVSVHEDEQPQQQQQKRKCDKAHEEQALRARLWLGFHAVRR